MGTQGTAAASRSVQPRALSPLRSPLDTEPGATVGQGVSHYSRLPDWLAATGQLSERVLLCDLRSKPGEQESRWYEALVALTPRQSTAAGRRTISPYVDALNNRSLRYRAFVWPGVELRLYGEAHDAPSMTRRVALRAEPPPNGTTAAALAAEPPSNVTDVPVFPSHWFNADLQRPNGPLATPFPTLSLEAHDRATHGAPPHRAPSTRCTADPMHHVWHRCLTRCSRRAPRWATFAAPTARPCAATRTSPPFSTAAAG